MTIAMDGLDLRTNSVSVADGTLDRHTHGSALSFFAKMLRPRAKHNRPKPCYVEPCYVEPCGTAIPIAVPVVRIGPRGERVPATALGPECRQPHRKEGKDDDYAAGTNTPEVQKDVID